MPMDQLHPLLRRQWQRHVGRDVAPTDTWQPLLQSVSEAYAEFDAARRLVERALELSSNELHAANAELRGVLQVLPDLLFRVGADNQLGGVMQGSTAVQHPALRAMADSASAVADQFRRATEHVRAARAPASFEFVCRTEPGAPCFEVRLLPFIGADIIGLVRDVSDRKQAERDRLVLGKLESTGILAGGIAHDFNNLLTTILLNLDLLQAVKLPPEEVDAHLATIRQGVLAAQILTQQLITFARGGAGVRQSLHLGPLLRESVPLALSGSNVRCDLDITDDLWPAEVDPGQLGQVIRNLVLNAREAMPSGGVISLEARNAVLPAQNAAGLVAGDYVQIRLLDHGAGIPAEMLPRIFDPYFSTKMRGTQKGMGLGLTICHSIVQKHAGAIIVESELGRGSTFVVYLPRCERPPSPAMPPANRAPAAIRGRVLVMDDEPMVRTVFKTVLMQIGYDAEVVADGRAAVDAYVQAHREQRAFNAVILDLTVKGEMGGEQAARELRAVDPDVRAIVMSGYSNDSVMREYQQHGFMARLVKPFDTDTLRDTLRRVLGS
jgi:signal transduction histidine kinase/ActR/RegA family two-component response regulator